MRPTNWIAWSGYLVGVPMDWAALGRKVRDYTDNWRAWALAQPDTEDCE